MKFEGFKIKSERFRMKFKGSRGNVKVQDEVQRVQCEVLRFSIKCDGFRMI